MKLTTIIIIAIIGIASYLIYREYSKDKAEATRRKNQIMLESGILVPEGEKLRQELAQGFAPLDAYRDPELEEYVNKLPASVYYYSPDRLDEATSQLLFGSGTAPVYERMPMYPAYRAPEYVSQLQHDVPKPSRYDYVSKWDLPTSFEPIYD